MPANSITDVLAKCATTTRWSQGMCGQFCAAMYGYGFSGYVDAITQWNMIPAALKHPGSTDAPPGALLFWSGGSAGHGHVAIAVGDGSCFSIDISGPGTVSRVPERMIGTLWGLPYKGWSAPYFQGQEWQPVGIYGTDVSGYQPINFALSLPSSGRKVDFAFIKITEGTGYVNSKWTAQRQWARDHGLVIGFYHFARPGDPIAQADYFLSKVALAPGDVIAYDWEDAGVTNAQKDAWISYVQGRAPGHRVILYCNTSFWKTRDTTSFAGDGLWIATGGIPAGQPPIESNWLIHQYSTAGGYDHDLALFDSRSAMAAWALGDDDMPLSTEDKKWISDEVGRQLKALVYGLVWETDKMGPPAGQATTDNPTWQPLSLVRYSGEQAAAAAKIIADVLAQARSNGSGITSVGSGVSALGASLNEIKGTLAGLDLSQLPDEIAAKLSHLKIVLDIQEEV